MRIFKDTHLFGGFGGADVYLVNKCLWTRGPSSGTVGGCVQGQGLPLRPLHARRLDNVFGQFLAAGASDCDSTGAAGDIILGFLAQVSVRGDFLSRLVRDTLASELFVYKCPWQALFLHPR